jgi:hypothetical protein
VVITIILLVSAVALPTVLPAINHRQVGEAARILQGAVVGARDQAIHDGQPSGIRLLPDPTFLTRVTNTNSSLYGQIDPTAPLAFNRIIPIGLPPAYRSGVVSVYSPTVYFYSSLPGLLKDANGNLIENVLVLEQAPTTGGVLNEQTAWSWNIRVGDKVQVGSADQVYTVVGPMAIGPAGGNAELFVNYDATNQPVRVTDRTTNPPTTQTITWDYLYLVNGIDDDGNGIVDDGHNGLPNSPTNGYYCEAEKWIGYLAAGAHQSIPYTITRRPAPLSKGREINLPTDVVIDASSWAYTRERSRFPVGAALNVWTGAVDILLNPDGTVVASTLYSTPAAVAMDGAFYHFWLAERSDVAGVQVDSNGNVVSLTSGLPQGTPPQALPIGQIASPTSAATYPYTGPTLGGEYRLLTLFVRTGQITGNETMGFDNPAEAVANKRGYNQNLPFVGAGQGVGGVQ